MVDNVFLVKKLKLTFILLETCLVENISVLEGHGRTNRKGAVHMKYVSKASCLHRYFSLIVTKY